MIIQIHQVVFLVLLLGTCAYALWIGRDSERWTAYVLLASAVASLLVQTSIFFRAEYGILLVDLSLLGFLMWLALRSDRFWPLYAAGFQIVGTTIHLARLVDSELWARAYATGQAFWAYPVLLALVAGTWLEARYRTR